MLPPRALVLGGALVVTLTLAACGDDGEERSQTSSPDTASPTAVPTDAPAATRPPGPTDTPPPTAEPDEFEAAFVFEEIEVWDASTGYDFDFPNQMAVGPDGNLYLTEFSGGRLFKITQEGEILAQWAGPETLSAPTGIAVDADGFIYVGESGSSRWRVFNPLGEVVGTFGKQGSGDGEFGSAMGIDVHEDGRVFVVDFAGARVQVFTKDGEFLYAFGEQGFGPGLLLSPIGLELEADGTVLVADRGGQRLQRYTSDGEFMHEFGFDLLGLTGPEIVSVDAEGRILLSDPRAGRVVLLDRDGRRLASVEGMSLVFPHGTALIGDILYLADTGNNAIRVLRLVPVAGN